MWIEFERFALSEGGRVALNENKNGVLVATESQNCRSVDGALRGGLGVRYIKNGSGVVFAVPSDIQRAILLGYYDQSKGWVDVPVYVASNRKAYLYSEETGKFKNVYENLWDVRELCPEPIHKDKNSFFAVNDTAFYYLDKDGVIFEKEDVCNGSVCTFYDRVFYACEQGVRFSDVGNYTDYSSTSYGSGKINFFSGDGRVDKIIPYDDGIVVVKSNRLWLFRAAGAADQFSAEPLPYYGDKIVEKSAARCGKFILFITVGGAVFRLHGKTFVKLVDKLPEAFCAANVTTAADGERYFVSAGESTLVIDAESGSSYRSYSLVGMSSCDGSVVGAYKGKLCAFSAVGELPDGQTATYSVREWLAEDGVEKRIESLRLFGEGVLTLSVSDGRGKIEKSVELDECGVDVEIGLRAAAFELSLALQAKTCLRKIAVKFNKVGGAA